MYNYANVQWQRSHSHFQAVNSRILGAVWSKYDANKPSHMQDPCMRHKGSCNLGVLVGFRLLFVAPSPTELIHVDLSRRRGTTPYLNR